MGNREGIVTMGPTMTPVTVSEYDPIPVLQFKDYSSAEYSRLLGMMKENAFPTKVEFQTADPLSPNAWEVVISVTAETHGYPSEKEVNIQPGQLVIWFGGDIYVLSCTKEGVQSMTMYRYPGIQDVQAGDML